MTYRRSVTLRTDIDTREPPEPVKEQPWARLSLTWQPDVIVLNRGAHFSETSDLLDGVRSTLLWMQEFLPRAVVLWRNTPHGHPGCDNATGPLLAPLAAPALAAMPFHWNAFPSQNDALEAMIKRDFPGVLHIDVATPTNLRPDGHPGNG